MLDNPTQTTSLEIAKNLDLIAFSHSSGPRSSKRSQVEQGPLEQLCAQAMESLPEEVESFRQGNVNVLNRIIGRVMKDSRGRADAQATRATIIQMINEQKQ